MESNSVWCGLCGIMYDRESMQQHSESEDHKAKLAGQEMPFPKEREVLNSKENSLSPEDEVSAGKQPSCSVFSLSYACNICEINCTGPESLQQHMGSLKHRKVSLWKQQMKFNETQLEEVGHYETGTPETSPRQLTDSISCHLCDKKFSGQIPYMQHLLSSGHTKKQQQKSFAKSQNTDLTDRNVSSSTPTFEGEGTFSLIPQFEPYARCETCDKKFSGPESYQQHMISKVHKKKIANTKFIQNMQSGKEEKGYLEIQASKSTVLDASNAYLGYPDGYQVPTFARCNICQKSFSGPVPYQQHMISEIHLKQMKKHEIIKKINNMHSSFLKADDNAVRDENPSVTVKCSPENSPSKQDSQGSFCSENVEVLPDISKGFATEDPAKTTEVKEIFNGKSQEIGMSDNKFSPLLDCCKARNSSHTAEDVKVSDDEFSQQEKEAFVSKFHYDEGEYVTNLANNLETGNEIGRDPQRINQLGKDSCVTIDPAVRDLGAENNAAESENRYSVDIKREKLSSVYMALDSPSSFLHECNVCRVKLHSTKEIKEHYESNEHHFAKTQSNKTERGDIFSY